MVTQAQTAGAAGMLERYGSWLLPLSLVGLLVVVLAVGITCWLIPHFLLTGKAG